MLFLLTICVCAVASEAVVDQQFVTVNTSSGVLRGKVDQDHIKPVFQFFGVPFAQPPIGKLRFTAPTPVSQWTGVKDALEFGHNCMQQSTIYDSIIGGSRNRSEDCLYLNVYTPSVSASLPVMLFIHGGGYFLGTGAIYDGTSLATKDVVMVTINYRLDLFGFLSTEDDAMPGNYGMLDQIAALRWVQDNIANFGGDPKRVTVFGQSAGAASVSLLVLSPLAKGLFQRAIMQSGVSLTPWAVSYPGNVMSPKVVARLVGSSVQCVDFDNTTRLLSCLKNVDAETLIKASAGITKAAEPTLIMIPRIETTYGFLPDYPLNLIRQGKFNDVDSIRGFNDDELGMAIAPLINTAQGVTTDVAERFIKGYISQFNELEQDRLIKFVTSVFNLGVSSSIPLEKQAVDILDFFQQIGPAIVETHEIVQSSKHNNFLYSFDYKPGFKHNSPDWMSAGHGDELAFVFNVSRKTQVPRSPTLEDIAVSNQLMDMWTNFAKTGDPTSTVPSGGAQWKPYSQTETGYLHINSTSTMGHLVSLQEQVNNYFRFMQGLDSDLKPINQHVVVG